MKTNIDINIEQLVLNGFKPGDRDSIGESVRQELAQLITEQGIPSSFYGAGETSRMDGGQIKVAPGARADIIGINVAQSVYGSFTK